MVTYRQLAIVLAFQAPLICLIICSYYFAFLGRNGFTSNQYILAKVLALTCVGDMICEILCGFILYGIMDFDKSLYISLCTVAYFLMLVNAILWSEFCFLRMNNPPKRLVLLARILYVLTFVLVFMRIVLVKTKLYVYFEKKIIKFGPLDNLQTYFCFLIYVLLMVILVMKYRDRLEYANRERYGKMIIANAIMIMAMVIYGTVFYPYVMWIGYTLVLLHIFISNQRASIYADELTGLGNRRLMIKNLSEDSKIGHSWSLIMIDVNSFKSINDTYGHHEGDDALVIVSSILSKVATENDSIAYRHGGDEFVIIHNTSDPEEVKSICKLINLGFDEFNKENRKPYKLSVSSGFAVHESDSSRSIPDIIEEADKKMYIAKNRKKIKSRN